MSTPRWEVQWHPACGKAVRRFRFNRRLLIVLMAGGSLVLLIILFLLMLSGFGVWGLFHQFNLEGVRLESDQLQEEKAQLRQELLSSSRQVDSLLGRGRRLAWVFGIGSALTPVEDPPSADASDGDFAAWLQGAGEELVSLAAFLEGRSEEVRPPLAALPTGGPVEPFQAVPVALYGRRISPFTGMEESHHGVTWAAPEGEPVLAAGGGRVAWVGAVRERRANEWTRFGNVVVLDHGAGVYSVYGHLGSMAVRRGQQVVRGDRVGEVGQTGWTRTPSLYWEVRWPVEGVSRPVDPALVNLALPLDDLSGRLSNPAGDLDGGFAGIERLVGIR